MTTLLQLGVYDNEYQTKNIKIESRIKLNYNIYLLQSDKARLVFVVTVKNLVEHQSNTGKRARDLFLFFFGGGTMRYGCGQRLN